MMRLMLIGVCLFMSLATARGDDFVEPLPGTEPLKWDGDLADRMMAGLHKFVEDCNCDPEA
jgi:hypothetical protein